MQKFRLIYCRIFVYACKLLVAHQFLVYKYNKLNLVQFASSYHSLFNHKITFYTFMLITCLEQIKYNTTPHTHTIHYTPLHNKS